MTRRVWLFIGALALISPLRGGEQGWASADLSLTLHPRLSALIGREIRARRVTLDDEFLKAVYADLTHSLPDNFWWGGGFRRETIIRTSGSTNENRVVLQAGWKPLLPKGFKGDVRARTELRNFVEPSEKDHTRYRLRTGVRRPLSLASRSYIPYLLFELFADTKDDKINRNRLYAGTDIVLTERVKFGLGYVRQDTDRVEKDHALQMTLKGSF